MQFLSYLITYFQPFIVSSQQQETSTTNISGQSPSHTDAICMGDFSDKCATSKVSKTTSPVQPKPTNKSSNRRNIFKHMPLGKAFLNRTADGNDKMKTVDTVTTNDKEALTIQKISSRSLDSAKHQSVRNEIKIQNEVESGSLRNNEILRAEVPEEVREVDAYCLIDKLRIKRKTFVRSSTIHTATASDEHSKSISGSKIMLGKAISMHTPFSVFNISDRDK